MTGALNRRIFQTEKQTLHSAKNEGFCIGKLDYKILVP